MWLKKANFPVPFDSLISVSGFALTLNSFEAVIYSLPGALIH